MENSGDINGGCVTVGNTGDIESIKVSDNTGDEVLVVDGSQSGLTSADKIVLNGNGDWAYVPPEGSVKDDGDYVVIEAKKDLKVNGIELIKALKVMKLRQLTLEKRIKKLEAKLEK